MRKIGLITTFLLNTCLILVSPAVTSAQQTFIQVSGGDLNSRIESAVKQAGASQRQTPFWTAYAFDVRPGIAIDMDYSNFNGNINNFGNTSVAIGTSNGVAVETRNLGIFALHDSGGAITRLDIYNLDRRREYSGYPVYWLGRAGNEESLNFVKGLVGIPASSNLNRVTEPAITAIAVHDDPRVAGILKDMVQHSTERRVRNSAVFWLAHIGGETAFLADLMRNDQENLDLRKQAIFGIGASREAGSFSILSSFYNNTNQRELKKQVMFAASITKDEDQGIDFLIKNARDESDREVQKQAIFWLGQKASNRAMAALKDMVESSDADTQVQKQAVFAISQRPHDESVPLLIKIAKTNPKPEVRKQAIFWLGQTADARAIEFFKELLSK